MNSVSKTRICRACKQEKQIEEFYFYNKKENKRRFVCKECFSNQNKTLKYRYKKENQNKEIDLTNIRVCIVCKQEKQFSEFSKHLSSEAVNG
jgi:hypothetical protein